MYYSKLAELRKLTVLWGDDTVLYSMILPIDQQLVSLVQRHNNILVCLPSKPSTDAISSGLALFMVLKKMNKNVKVVASQFALPATHRFLPKSDEIEHELTALRKFVISVDTTKTKVTDVQYTLQDNKLNIYVTPQNGYFETRDVSTSASDYEFDLIIVLDSRDLEALGKVYEDNAEFFYHTPIVNIDHHPGNEHFGQVNLVNVKATSISEIVFELLEQFDSGQLLDEVVATHLLTGIISKTKSFQTHSVTPRSLAIASHLISSGARREEIVKNLYQTKSLQTLKLWGRVLSQLQADPDHKIVWASITEQDFLATQTGPFDLEQVVDELIVNTPDVENVYLLYEHAGTAGATQVHALIYTAPYIHGLEAFQEWQSHGSEHFTYITFPANVTAAMAQTFIHERLRSLVKP